MTVIVGHAKAFMRSIVSSVRDFSAMVVAGFQMNKVIVGLSCA
ncbi:hypothetical protein [Prosthecochloris sp. CIB 2401]|nr:hypothetical protein [Prosthecochloris sp. CIB 2401]